MAGAGRYNLSVSVLMLFFLQSWVNKFVWIFFPIQPCRATMLCTDLSCFAVHLLVRECTFLYTRLTEHLDHSLIPRNGQKKIWQRPRSTMPWKNVGKFDRPRTYGTKSLGQLEHQALRFIRRLSQIPICPAMLSKTVLPGLHFQSFWLTVIIDAYCQKTMKLFQTSTHHRFLFPRRGRSQTTTNASWPLGQIV